MLDNLWLGDEEGQAIATALVPKLQKTKTAVEGLLFEVATLEVALQVSEMDDVSEDLFGH